MDTVRILVDLAKDAHRAEVAAKRPARHLHRECPKCRAIIHAETQLETAEAMDGMVVLYIP